jgi:hypothetical protein
MVMIMIIIMGHNMKGEPSEGGQQEEVGGGRKAKDTKGDRTEILYMYKFKASTMKLTKCCLKKGEERG